MATISISLPFPPTVNTYWRHVGRRTLISKRGRAYKANVAALCLQAGMRPLQGDLRVTVVFCPPDRRVRDLDNLWKALLDGMTGRAYFDDSQVAEQHGSWGPIVKGGRADLVIESL